MTSASNSIPVTSTALVPYDPTLPHISVGAHLESIVDRVRSIEEARYLNTYKALHLGGKETLESRMIQVAATHSPTHSNEEMAQRLSNYGRVARHLNRLTDEQLSLLLTTAKPLQSRPGGETLSIEVEGVPLFVKKVRLSVIEELYPRSTLNLFDLPPYYQYGVGSMGFGAWREISAHEMTTQWILNGECQNFPLMYHSRVLPRSTSPTVPMGDQLEERQRYVEYWDGSEAVGVRAEAMNTASSDIVIFMENLPQTMNAWLRIQGENGNLTPSTMNQLEHELNMVVAFMKARGFLHFDAHFHNILAHNNHVYFADFGLAMNQKFDLSPKERVFFEQHRDYDRYYVIAELFKSAIIAALGDQGSEEVLDKYLADGIIERPLPIAVALIAQRYGPIAILMEKFFHSLRETSKNTPYPATELSREWARL